MADGVGRAEARAIKLLVSRGYSVIEPQARPAAKMLDQCEYPNRQGLPGECCTSSASRNRKTIHGSMWLCSVHIGAPESDIFDERINADERSAADGG